MVQSRLTLLAVAGTALAGVVRREEAEVDHLKSEDLSYPPPPLDWVTSTPHHFEVTDPSSTSFVQVLSEHLREPQSTYLPSGLSSHFPQPTEEVLPPFITSFPEAGEFAHTKDSARPTSFSPAISHPAPPGASYDGPPPNFSEPVKPEEPQLNSPPPVLQASSSHPPIPSSHAETTYASPTQPPSFTEPHPRPSEPVSVKPTEPWDGLDAAKPTSSPDIPSWISHLPPPSEIIPAPKTTEKSYDTAPSALPEAYQGPPPLPFDSIPSEPHGSPPAVPHHTPSPGESEQEPHPLPFESASGKPPEPASSSPAAVSQTLPPHRSYQGPPPLKSGSSGPTGESDPPAGTHTITPAESYQGPSPTLTMPGEPSQPKGSLSAGLYQIPSPTESHHESSPPPFESTSAEPHDPESSSPESYQLPSLSAPNSSHPSDADHPTEPATPHEGPSPHYGAAPKISCTCKEHPQPGESNLPPLNPPSEHGEVPHELAPPHAIPKTEESSDTLTDAYVPHVSKPEPTVNEAPSVSHVVVPRRSSNPFLLSIGITETKSLTFCQ